MTASRLDIPEIDDASRHHDRPEGGRRVGEGSSSGSASAPGSGNAAAPGAAPNAGSAGAKASGTASKSGRSYRDTDFDDPAFAQRPDLSNDEVYDRLLRRERLANLKIQRRALTVWMLVGVGILVAALGYVLNILSLVVGILLWTVVIIFCLRGIVEKLEDLGVHRLIGTTVAYIVMFGAFFGLGALFLSPTIGFNDQVQSLMTSAPYYAQAMADWVGNIYRSNLDFFQNAVVHRWLEGFTADLTNWASDVARGSAGGVIAFGSGVASSFLTFGFALVIAFWILLELPALGRETMRLAGPKRARDLEMLHVTLTRIMGGYIKGTLLQCVVIGVLCGIFYRIIDLPNFAALAGITGLMNLIPIVGPWFGGAIAAIVGLIHSPLTSLLAIVGAILISQFVYTFISPRIMSNSVDVHPALVLLALMVGSEIGGAMAGVIGTVVGMLASIPVAAAAKSVFVYYFEKSTGRQLVSDDGVFFQGTPTDDGVDPLADAISPHPDAGSASSVTAAFAKIAPVKARGAKGADDPSTKSAQAGHTDDERKR